MLKDLLNEQVKKAVKTYTVKPEKMSMSLEEEMKHYPSIYFDSKTLPEVKNWNVGEEYYVLLKVKQMSKSMSMDSKEEMCDARFEIHEISALEVPETPSHEKKEMKKEGKEEGKEHGGMDKMKKMYGV